MLIYVIHFSLNHLLKYLLTTNQLIAKKEHKSEVNRKHIYKHIDAMQNIYIMTDPDRSNETKNCKENRLRTHPYTSLTI